jgi:hypothetical protein
MIALALRRQRGALATVAGIVLLCAIGLVALFTGGYQFEGAPQLAVFCMPLLVGLITGTTLFAREFDNSAHHFTLTQSVRPTAWWASAVGVAAIATALAAGALSLLTSLMARGLAAGRPEPLWLYPPWFETTGTAAIAYALLAFSISATVGLLTRSTLAGVVTAMVAYIVVMLVLNSIRVDYLPAETVTTPLGRSDASPIPEGARPAGYAYVDGTGQPIHYAELERLCGDNSWEETCLRGAGAAAEQIRYQPASRYWPFQLIESGILLGLSAVVVAAGRIGLRRATRP